MCSRKSSPAFVVAEVPALVLFAQVGPQRYPRAVFLAAVLQGAEMGLLVVPGPARRPLEPEAALIVKPLSGLVLPFLLQLVSELCKLQPELLHLLLKFLLFPVKASQPL